MALTMRLTGLSSPTSKNQVDFTICDDGEAVGRIYENRGIGTRPDQRWLWSITVHADPRSGIVTSGKVQTLDMAKVQFSESWTAWKAWTKVSGN
jgi:hypothetical protein